MHYARSSRTIASRRCDGRKRPSYRQRCSIRVTYLKNQIRGQWKAHGRYLARESASFPNDPKGAGFDRETDGIDIAWRLKTWQTGGDELIWKLIISPEFGDRLDLSRLTRDLIKQMEDDLGTDLEWIAVEHHNTEHPHIHVAVRGIRTDGRSLRLTRDYVQHGIRHIAEDLCTRRLGYRTELDACNAERSKITEKGFTSIDRRLQRNAQPSDSEVEPRYFTVTRNPAVGDSQEMARLHLEHEIARLAVLRQMGLAELIEPTVWRVRRDCEQILRAMQRTSDRQRTLAAHGALLSDERLPIEVLDPRHTTSVEGRILVHGQDEQTGRNYFMLEGTDAKIHFINYTVELEEARSRGKLRANSFVRLRKLVGAEMLDIVDLGDAEKLLSSSLHMNEIAHDLLNRGTVPTEDGWGGWLGRYQAVVRKTTTAILQRREPDLAGNHERKRQRGHSFGR
jgi:type IV secretory pathway VirD2 relaxase